MPIQLSRQRLADLLIDPREDLDLEIKNWLDLRGDNDAKATFAKATLALANHGGGFILLGLTETDRGCVEAEGRPPTLDGYSQDVINGIIQNYADPAFHCAVHIVARQDEQLFPVVVVPGDHRSPIRARRAGPHGNIVENNAIYVRKPGPRSETPTSGQEWDALLRRSLANRRDEMLDQIRDLISGAVPAAAQPAGPARFDQWTEQCLARWEALIADLPPEAPERCPHGYYFVAYELIGDLRTIPPGQLPELLQRSVVRHTGWPPFWFPTRRGIEPYPIDGVVECWLGREADAGAFGQHDAAHSDFWRISPDGLAFLLRGYQEDGLENRPPHTLFDVTLPIWRIGEALLHAERLAGNLVDGPATVTFAVHYRGLAGRSLNGVNGRRLMFEGHVARQDAITERTTIEAASIGPNLPEIIHPLLAPLYALFEFFDLPMALVTEELAQMRRGNL
ncbi:AlbA family DNA-binding domain-containing protein [Xanthobacter autotrophicus]|uniref:AlbA family DNA-binding domain-containing protein n=1 Tax=Xanthobacter autotrophicus TaxID=280 RepID=UPI00372AAA83